MKKPMIYQKKNEIVCCIDEKTSIQARKGITEIRPAIRGHIMQHSCRYDRQGALQLFCALIVATGLVFTQCYEKKCFSDFKNFLLRLFNNALCQGIRVFNLILDNGSTHAPKQLGKWIVALNLSFEVRIFWLPKYASWLDQAEIIFSKVQRDLLTPNDFSSTKQLKHELNLYFDELNSHPKPIKWLYTKEKLIAKFKKPIVPKKLAA